MAHETLRVTPGARIPVKLHRRVCLVQTEDAVLAEELLARKKLAQEVVGRLTDRVLLVRPGRVDAVVQELQKLGHTPQVSIKDDGRKPK
jgi:DNA-binding TFAR19-related protein (PDSD5 family)